MTRIRQFPSQHQLRERQDISRSLGVPIETLLRLVDFVAPYELVLASGSLVEGFGNMQSDIDIFVLTSKRTPSSRIFYSAGLNRTIDETRIRLDDLVNLQNQLANRKGARELWGISAALSYKTTDLYYRLAIGIKMNDPYAISKFHRNISLDHKLVQDDVILGAINAARQLWQDSAGALGSGHVDQARVSARLGIERVIDAYGAILGELYHGEKWRWARLHRVYRDPLNFRELFDRYGPSNACSGTKAQDDVVHLADCILQVMWLVKHGTCLRKWPKHEPLECFELHDGQVARVDLSGRIESECDALFEAEQCAY